MKYRSIDSDKEIAGILEEWKRTGVQQVAIDFEGEFNLHCYGEHLCLVQIFDGRDFYLVDTLAADQAASRQAAADSGKPFVPFAEECGKDGVTAEGLRHLLESPLVEKLWFDCTSDGELVWKKFGIRLARVYDLFQVAKLLGLVGPGLAGNLAALTERFVTTKAAPPPEDSLNRHPTTEAPASPKGMSKKRLQQTNWMLRPLSSSQLEYALKDVAHLFALREALEEQARSRKLLSQVAATMKGLPHLRQDAVEGYSKMPGYRRLTPSQQLYLRHFFDARDTVARQLNKPPFQILDKHLLVQLAKKSPLTPHQLQATLGSKTRPARLLLPLLLEATATAQKSLADPPSR